MALKAKAALTHRRNGSWRRDGRAVYPDRRLVLVVVVTVGSVAVAVMQVVHVVAVRNCNVAAAFAMGVIGVGLSFNVLSGFTLVPVAVMFTVDMTVVQEVGVVTVWERYVAAVGSVSVVVVFVDGVCYDDSPFLVGGSNFHYVFIKAYFQFSFNN